MAAKQGLGLVYHGEKLMPWGKGAVANGFVFLSGTEGRDPANDTVVEGMTAQLWMALDKIKGRLAEAGTSIENAVKLVWYVVGREHVEEFRKAKEEWLAKNAPKLLEEKSCAETLLLVAGLALPEMVVEVDVIAAIS